MFFINISDYPILIELIHDGTVVRLIVDEWGTTNVYLIRNIHFLNRTGLTWTITANDELGHTYTATINPLQEGTINLPPPKRFESAPLRWSLTFVQG